MEGRRGTLWAVVMAGGSGTRFWPVSRKGRPKQFLPPGGGPPSPSPPGDSAGASLLSLAVKRLKGLAPPEHTLVLGAAPHRRLLQKALPGIPRNNIVLEPEGRNTAPSLGLAAHLIEGWEPGAVMAAFPADHHVGRAALLRRLVRSGARLATERDAIVILGIEPRRPETGYGYVQRGRKFRLPGGVEAYAARRFTEKPSPAQAKRFLASGDYYWNGGFFICRAARAIQEIERNLPETGRLLLRAATALRQGKTSAYERAFRGCQAISIDYAVLERARGVVVLPAAIDWTDVGSWTALRSFLPRDEAGNVWILPKGSRALAGEARRLIVRSSKPLVAALGVEDLVVVETEDALLICTAERAQAVGELVKRLGVRGLGRFL